MWKLILLTAVLSILCLSCEGETIEVYRDGKQASISCHEGFVYNGMMSDCRLPVCFPANDPDCFGGCHVAVDQTGDKLFMQCSNVSKPAIIN